MSDNLTLLLVLVQKQAKSCRTNTHNTNVGLRNRVCVQDPWRAGSGANSPFAGAAGLLQLRLLQAYLLLPKAGAFAPEHASLLRLCASALKGTSAPSGMTAAEDHVSWDRFVC